MDCGYLFLIKDRKKILKKLEKNEKIYIDKQNNYYSLCKVSKEPNFVHCRRHLNLIEREIEFVNELREISIDDFTNVDMKEYIKIWQSLFFLEAKAQIVKAKFLEVKRKMNFVKFF